MHSWFYMPANVHKDSSPLIYHYVKRLPKEAQECVSGKLISEISPGPCIRRWGECMYNNLSTLVIEYLTETHFKNAYKRKKVK